MKHIISVLLILCLIGGHTDIVVAEQASPNTWGLAIGISDYSLPELRLKWADKDAIEFSTFLRYTLGLPEEHYRILKNREATRDNIREALGWLSLVAEPNDRVYLFYSGHGKDDSPIVPYDIEQPFPMDLIKKALKKIDAHDIIFFADACYSGRIAENGAKTIIGRESLTGLSQTTIRKMVQESEGTVIMTSADGIQEAYERDGQKNGLFTYHLMNTLMDPSIHPAVDLDQNGEVSLYEIYQNVRYLVSSESRQDPQISSTETAKKIILFSTAPTTTVPVEEATPSVSSGSSGGMGGATKAVLGIGAVAAIGGGLALAGSSGGSSDPDPTPTPDSTDNIEARLMVSPLVQETCGSVTNSLYVTNLTLNDILIERIDYEEQLLLDEPPTSCKQGRQGSFWPDVTTVRSSQWALVRQWEHESYPCDECPYSRFSECSYRMQYTVNTSAGAVEVEPATVFVRNGENFCSSSSSPSASPTPTPTPASEL
ncbi:hypothetical protein CSA56_13900 [candidate division KSB3 bacterium]|uniref:Peptidase C14 caspase domain-containing protein n=1 Tax=candidate division KSB3 bacterium TaxID=2044937 RepID=A0A2G6KB69_9BACT|nr:MAG: hypothetical protein CSA56_13900 [candidate division KSB3 bacterium]